MLSLRFGNAIKRANKNISKIIHIENCLKTKFKSVISIPKNNGRKMKRFLIYWWRRRSAISCDLIQEGYLLNPETF